MSKQRSKRAYWRRRRHGRVPQRLAKALELVEAAPLPARAAVRLSGHAVHRFRERCVPDLPLDAARARLLELVGTRGNVVRDRPRWLGGNDGMGRRLTTIAYVVVGEGEGAPFVLPVVMDGGPLAVTCIRRDDVFAPRA